jgi:hypothetical protein
MTTGSQRTSALAGFGERCHCLLGPVGVTTKVAATLVDIARWWGAGIRTAFLELVAQGHRD